MKYLIAFMKNGRVHIETVSVVPERARVIAYWVEENENV